VIKATLSNIVYNLRSLLRFYQGCGDNDNHIGNDNRLQPPLLNQVFGNEYSKQASHGVDHAQHGDESGLVVLCPPELYYESVYVRVDQHDREAYSRKNMINWDAEDVWVSIPQKL
jgi:hypothetical protein